jgi:hypothetical protein
MAGPIGAYAQHHTSLATIHYSTPLVTAWRLQLGTHALSAQVLALVSFNLSSRALCVCLGSTTDTQGRVAHVVVEGLADQPLAAVPLELPVAGRDIMDDGVAQDVLVGICN